MGITAGSGSMGAGMAGTPISRRQMRFLVAVVSVLMFGTILTALNVYELHNLTREHRSRDRAHGEAVAEARGMSHYARPVAWVRGSNKGSGYLTHVTNVFTRLGYDLADDDSAQKSTILLILRSVTNMLLGMTTSQRGKFHH
ncbi:hypothetical protein OTU49_005532 [Cherax quadricarinatus]|uniref:Uncharacterized protein n=1 Tax=Cherax quadricarinatus TaxID=27406 RepID=A0AAW0WSE3_CHEQU